MAELFHGRVLQLPLPAGCDVACRRTIEGVLDSVDGVSGYVIDDKDGTITAFADGGHAAEVELVRALVASGMFPIDGTSLTEANEVDRHVC